MIRQLPSAPPRRGLPAVGKAVQCGFEELESDYEWIDRVVWDCCLKDRRYFE